MAFKSNLSDKIEQFQIHLYHRALDEKNLNLIAAYLKDNGNLNILKNGQHPLAIIWGYLQKQDKDILEILEYLVENKCDVNAKVCDGKTLGDAIRENLSKQTKSLTFFKKEDSTLQSALKIIKPYEKSQKYFSILQDIYLLDCFKISPNTIQIVNFMLITYIAKIMLECEFNNQDCEGIVSLIFSQLCLKLLNKFDDLVEKNVFPVPILKA